MNSENTLWFPERWPAKHPDRIQLYSLATPNGQKIGIALEEMALTYEAHLINIMEGDQHDPSYLKLSPNGKIPTLSDPNGPNGQVLLMESGAILEYLAEKTGLFFGDDISQKLTIKQWLYFQMGHIGPMFGQFGHFFKYAKETCDHPYPVERYTKETQRLLQVMDQQLQSHPFIAGTNYSIADMAIWPWVDCLGAFYNAGDALGLAEYQNVQRWSQQIQDRPAVQRGRTVCNIPD